MIFISPASGCRSRRTIKRVGVELPAYADNVALPAFARRCCLAPAVQQSIDISCPPGPQQQTCSSGFAAVGHAETYKRTDGRTYRRTNSVPFYRPCSADWAYAGTAIKQKLKNRIAEQTKNDTGWLINSYYLHESLLKIYRTFSLNTPRVKAPVQTRS